MTTASLLAYLGSAVLIAWGAAHLMPTSAVADSFGSISVDNRRIFVMKWIAEGITHISIGVLVILITAIEGAAEPASHLVYRVSAAILIVLAALTAARERAHPRSGSGSAVPAQRRRDPLRCGEPAVEPSCRDQLLDHVASQLSRGLSRTRPRGRETQQLRAIGPNRPKP